MRKIMIRSLSIFVLFLGLLFANNVAASALANGSDDGKKDNKKETVKAKADKAPAKVTLTKKDQVEPSTAESPQNEQEGSEEYLDPDNPQNNFDCTKAGFDRE